jgi:hypothetical protein
VCTFVNFFTASRPANTPSRKYPSRKYPQIPVPQIPRPANTELDTGFFGTVGTEDGPLPRLPQALTVTGLMPKFSIKWMKQILDWGKRVQFVFQVVMFLFSASVVGAVVGAVRAAITYGTHLPALWRFPIYCFSGAVALLCCAAVGNWWNKRNRKVEQPVSTNVGKPAATRRERSRHNVRYIGTRTITASSDNPNALLACFQNEPIPHVPLATFSGAKVKIDFFRGNGEALGEVFPAPWTEATESEEPTMDLEAGQTCCAVIAAIVDGKWQACEMRTVSTLGANRCMR